MKYYIGLDIGTSSVGWAVTDERYNIIRRKGKDMWGARLFDEASTSAERRSFRTGRRRLQRENARKGYLKEIFAPAINENDPGFFARLEDSKLHIEDKRESQPFALFADTGFTDREYYEKYPTIFHLRKELLESGESHDVRLVYLAILNMYSHRGHFLNPNLDEGDTGSIAYSLDHLKAAVFEQFERDFPLTDDIADIEALLTDSSKSSTAKRESICGLLNIDRKDKFNIEIWKLICGLKGTLSVIFENDSFSDENKKYSVSFKDGNFEEKETEIEGMLSPGSFELFQAIKNVHDGAVLASVMKGSGDSSYEYISQARVASYEKHKQDLKILKQVYREYLPERYDDMFRIMKENNYSAYVGSVNSKEAETAERSGKIRRGCKSADFFKTVKNDLKKITGSENIEECNYINSEIDKGTFLPKQRITDNGIIPYQVHKKELRRILENAEGYLPFLKEIDPESQLTASERILELFSFRIPYYVGPLKENENSVSWVVRKEAGTVYPWNLSEKIDEKETSQRFIENLVRHCTYLSDEKVLPKSSLLYEKFMVLNELNNLKVHDEKIPVELKQKIYKELFRARGKRVTNSALINFLRKEGMLGANEKEEAVSGYDKEKGGFTNTLANYHKFAEVFGVTVLTDRQIEIAEDVIFYSTVYGDSGRFLKTKLGELYGGELSVDQIKRILGYKFKDWGNLSKEFLLLEGADTDSGEIKTIISRMWDENNNLMQLLDYDNYTYSSAVKDRSAKLEKTLQEITHEDLKELYISAPVRRMVWQTIRIVQELEKIMGEEPERIFVEMTRSEEKNKKRTISRKMALQELYKGCAEDEKYLAAGIESRDEKEFRIKKLYLYYRQKGRCMYSGEIIPFEKLFDDNFYDIDHIYPRHYVKDDSIENNLVLVKAELNREKTDEYPISADIRTKRAEMWKMLRQGNFISEEKYRRLTRTTSFSEEELIGFVNRQLVETGQGTKVVAQILTQVFSGGKANDRVVYSKAGNVSEFRQKYSLLKCRAVNDFHHANDAYLNIVVGNTYFTKYTRNARNFFAEKSRSGQRDISDHVGKIFDHIVERGDTLAWDPDKDIVTVRKVMSKNTPIVTKRSYEVHGGISDQQIVSAEVIRKAKGVGYIPIKASDANLSDTQKYGGFNKVSGAYFFLVEHTKKGKRVRTIESLPVYLAKRFEGKEGLEIYCRDILKLKDPDVRWAKIRMYSLVKLNGFYLYLTGRSNERLLVCNAVQLVIKPEYSDYVRKIIKTVENNYDDEYLISEAKRNTSNGKKNSNEIFITKEMNMALYAELKYKHKNSIYSRRPNSVGTKLEEGEVRFASLGLSEQCYILNQILQISQLINQGADLQSIGGSKKSGVAMISKEISNQEECKLILQSATGLYEQKIDLLTI